jgi:hypothetical protein
MVYGESTYQAYDVPMSFSSESPVRPRRQNMILRNFLMYPLSPIWSAWARMTLSEVSEEVSHIRSARP